MQKCRNEKKNVAKCRKSRESQKKGEIVQKPIKYMKSMKKEYQDERE